MAKKTIMQSVKRQRPKIDRFACLWLMSTASGRLTSGLGMELYER
jgi:hypothetical protein